MQNENIVTVDGKIKTFINGVQFKGVHNFSLDYIKGALLLFSCVADAGEPELQRARVLH